MEFFESTEHLVTSVLILLLYAAIFFISKLIYGWISAYRLNMELTSKDNTALAISLAGYFGGVTIIFVGAVDGPHSSLLEDIWHVGGYALVGTLFLNAARVINDKLILSKFSNSEEIIQRQNLSVGAVQAAAYLASALIIAGAIHGEGGGPTLAFVFFLIGQVALIVFALLYRKIVPYQVLDEIREGNLGAGLGFAGALIAIGVIAMKAVSGNFVSWADSLSLVAFDISLVFVYLIVVRFFFDKVIIPHADLNKEISEDKNIGAGVLEMFVAISFSLVLFYTL